MSEAVARAARRRWRVLLVLAILALVPRLVVAWTLPLGASPLRPECAPDEGLQFWTVARYATGDPGTWPESGSIYSAYPPVPYLLHAAALATARAGFGDRWPARFPSSWWRLRSYSAARLGGTLLGCLTAVLAALAAEAWSGSRRLAIASGVAVALYPQLVFVNGYVNADSFTIAAVMALTLALSRWAQAGEGHDGIAWVGAAAGLVLLGKPTGYAALVPTALWILDRRRRGSVDDAALGRVVAALMVTGGPFLAANAVRNHGDPLGLGKYRELLATSYGARHAAGMARLPGFLRDLAESSFGVFRNADLRLPSGFFVGAGVFAAFGVAAAREPVEVGGIARARGAIGRALVWLAAIVVLDLALVIWNAWTIDDQPQGRYLLPALIPLCIALTCALGASRRRGGVLLLLWLAFLASATLAGVALVHANPCL